MDLSRIRKIDSILDREGLDALIVDNPIDLFYLTHLKLSLGRLVVNRKGATLFVDGRYLEAAKRNAPCQVIDSALFVLEDQKVGFDASTTTFSVYQALQKQGKELVALHSPLKRVRMIKEESELTLLREAARIGSLGYDKVCTLLQEGITEQEVARELEIFWLGLGTEGPSFEPIIAFGANSSQPHYRPGKRALKKGDTVLIDIGVMKEGYASDMTRVVFFGAPLPKMVEIYGVVKEAAEEAMRVCKPGLLIKDLDRAAREVIEKRGYGKCFPHGLGHGVGLEVHEFPVIKNVHPFDNQSLEKGMVITIEPGVYLPEIGGVRLENTVVVTESGIEDLTQREFLLPTL